MRSRRINGIPHIDSGGWRGFATENAHVEKLRLNGMTKANVWKEEIWVMEDGRRGQASL